MFLPNFWWFIDSLKHSFVYKSIALIYFHGHLCPNFPFCKNISHIGLGPYRNDLIEFMLIITISTSFQISSYSEVLLCISS
jgi:hypothetical protein